MANELKQAGAALPPIANALRNMHCFLDRVVESGARTVATGPLAQQAAHMKAVIGEVAETERHLQAAEAELARLRPHQEFLAVCRELHREVLAARLLAAPLSPVDRLLGALESIREVIAEVMTTHGERDDFLSIAALAIDAVQLLDQQPAAPELEAANA